jgi:transposase
MRFLALDFREAIATQDTDGKLHLDSHRNAVLHRALVRFAHGLRKDLNAVIAAVESSRRNGQTKGQINCLKAIKRQMYGRA